MRVLVTGGAGCIGSDLAGRLLQDGHDVIVFDNLSSGKEEHIEPFLKNKRFRFIKADLLDRKKVENACKGIDATFHLAANSDIKYKPGDPTDEDLRLNTIATYNLLDAMRVNDVKKIAFTSSSSVYGEAKLLPTPEDHPLLPISLYSASKAACETLISAYCGMFGMQGWILRLANVIGPKSRRTGKTVISEFIERLGKNPNELTILGNGKQSKSYLLVDDCIDGMLTAFSKANEHLNIYNIGPEDFVTVDEIAKIVVAEMGLKKAKFSYTGGDRGWPGDVPKFLLDTSRIRKLGWKPRHSSEEAVKIATRSLLGSSVIV